MEPRRAGRRRGGSSGMGSAHAAGSVFLQLREAALTAVL